MAPVVLLGCILSLGLGTQKVATGKFSFIFLVFSFFLVRNLSFAQDATLFLKVIWQDAILFGYFLIPFLFIDRISRVDTVARLVSINAVVACLSAFLAATGYIELPYERFAESRIGFQSIQKSVGLITSYGDVAQIAVFFLFIGRFLPEKLLSIMNKRLVYISSLIIILLGLIGNQSRSFLLSVIAAYLVSWYIIYRRKRAGRTLLIDIMAGVTILISFAAIVLFGDSIIAILAGLGGREAMGTASARLLQYEAALRVIAEHPILGITAEAYHLHPDFAHGIHDLWLGQFARGGVVSILLLTSIFWILFRRCLKLFGNSSTLVYGKVLIGYLIAVVVSTLFYPADTVLFWSLLGVASGMIYTLRRPPESYKHTFRSVPIKTTEGRIRLRHARENT